MRMSFVFLLLLTLSPGATFAKTVSVPGQGASLILPDDWTVLQRPKVALVAVAPGQTAALGILVSSNNDLRQAHLPDAIEAMKQGLAAKAKRDGFVLKITDAGPRTLNGVPAGFVQTEQDFSPNRIIYSRVYNVAANGKLYLLTLDARDLRGDLVLEKIAGSFRFDRPPQLPGPSDFIVHRLGEVGGVILLVALAALLIRLALRRQAQ